MAAGLGGDSKWHVMERIEVAHLGVIGFVFFREDAAWRTDSFARAPAGVIRMTEDGRFSGMAALCSFSPSFFQDWGNQDAQLDAIANSLWPSVAKRFALRANEAHISKARCGAPALFSDRQPCIFRGDFL